MTKRGYDFVWDDVPRRIRKGYFLHAGPEWVGNFSGMDSKDLFEKNLLTQPIDWFYRDNPIEYKLNKYGYRTVDFDTIDWANSIVVFGCSNVFGVGLHERDTLSSQLHGLTNIPVINMGIGASSMEYSLYNSVILNEHYPTPKAVIHLWSAIDRATYYNKKNIEHHGTWNMTPNNYMDLYSTDPTHAKVHAILAQMISKQIWVSKTKYYEASFFGNTAGKLNLPTITVEDYARDLSHPGRLSIQKLALDIKDKLKL
jgi:hypothetical protein